jgi:hypothetical protein
MKKMIRFFSSGVRKVSPNQITIVVIGLKRLINQDFKEFCFHFYWEYNIDTNSRVFLPKSDFL